MPHQKEQPKLQRYEEVIGGDQALLFWDVITKVWAVHTLKLADKIKQDLHGMDQLGTPARAHYVESAHPSEGAPSILGSEEPSYDKSGVIDRKPWMAMIDIMAPITASGLDPKEIAELLEGILTERKTKNEGGEVTKLALAEKDARDALLVLEKATGIKKEYLLRRLAAGNWVGGGPATKESVTPIGSPLSEILTEGSKAWVKGPDSKRPDIVPDWVADMQASVVREGKVMKGPLQQMIYGMAKYVESTLPPEEHGGAMRRMAELFGRSHITAWAKENGIDTENLTDKILDVWPKYQKYVFEVVTGEKLPDTVEFGDTSEDYVLRDTKDGIKFHHARGKNILRLWIGHFYEVKRVYDAMHSDSGSAMAKLPTKSEIDKAGGVELPFFSIGPKTGIKKHLFIPTHFLGKGDQKVDEFLQYVYETEAKDKKQDSIIIAPGTVPLFMNLAAQGVMTPDQGSTYSKDGHEMSHLYEHLNRSSYFSLPMLARLGMLQRQVTRVNPRSIENMPDDFKFMLERNPWLNRVFALVGHGKDPKGYITGKEIKEIYKSNIVDNAAFVFNDTDLLKVISGLQKLVKGSPERALAIEVWIKEAAELMKDDKLGAISSEDWMKRSADIVGRRAELRTTKESLDVFRRVQSWYGNHPAITKTSETDALDTLSGQWNPPEGKSDTSKISKNLPDLLLILANDEKLAANADFAESQEYLRDALQTGQYQGGDKEDEVMKILRSPIVISRIYDLFIAPARVEEQAKVSLSEVFVAALDASPEFQFDGEWCVARQFAGKKWSDLLAAGQNENKKKLLTAMLGQVLKMWEGGKEAELLKHIPFSTDQRALLQQIKESRKDGVGAFEARRSAIDKELKDLELEYVRNVSLPISLMKRDVSMVAGALDYSNSRPFNLLNYVLSEDWLKNMLDPNNIEVTQQYYEAYEIPVKMYSVNGNKLLYYEDKMGIFAGNHPQEGAARRKLQDLLEEMEGDSIVVATHPNLKGADMQMRVFEKRTPDGDDIGEESVFCGNGALLMAYLHARSAEAQKRRIVVSNKLGNVVELGAESTDGITAHLEVDSFDIDQDTSKQIFGMWDGVKEVHLKKAAGEPHVVVEIDPDVPQQRRGGYESLALRIKSAIQKSSFGERVNVNFVFKQGDVVKAFVHERGVEGFTGSCGTGSASISSALNMDTATISFAIPDVSGSWSDGGVIEVTERGGKYGLHSQMINVTSGDSKDVHLKTKPEH